MYTHSKKHTLYSHYIELYHTTTDGAKAFARAMANFYGEMLGLRKDEIAEDLLPIVDFAALLGTKGSIAGDGEE